MIKQKLIPMEDRPLHENQQYIAWNHKFKRWELFPNHIRNDNEIDEEHYDGFFLLEEYAG